MKKIMSSILAAVLIAVILAGCTPVKSGEQYSAEFPYDPLQYMLFIKKEVSAVANRLSTCAGLAVNVANDHYPADRAAKTTSDGLAVIKQCHESVQIMRPPAEYIEVRESVLMLLTTIESDMSDLIAALEEPSPDKETLTALKNILLGDYASITAAAGTYWI